MHNGLRDIETAIAILRQRFGERVSTNQDIRERHGTDESYHAPRAPDAVVFPDTREDVQEIVKICGEYDAPVIPFGVGTSLEGHIAALEGGVSVDLGNLNTVLQINSEDLDVTVEAGVTRKKLNEDLRYTGLFFPIDPGADATIGGMSATRASGTNAVRYGTMRDNILSLGVVLPDGQYIRTGKRARKSSAGYDLTRIFVGSEGTLGVITDITLRLYGIPEKISSAVCTYPTIDDAVNTVILTIQTGVPIARMELIDEVQMQALNQFSGLGYAERPTLFFEFHGTAAGVAEQIESVRTISNDFGGSNFDWASKSEERSKLWQARHDAHYANMQLRPSAKAWPTDVCVPISRLAECIAETRRDIEESGLLAPIVGHVGDGNFHVDMVLDPDDPDEVARAVSLNKRLVGRALSMDGTCTGEHGVGYGKIDNLVEEHGAVAVNVMRELKQAIDPQNLMNPGKIVQL
ncbi:MAG: putative FAD-linked oxidoreductase [Alphaproteobacteria bacterium MarineAlpha11_Bin1]|nr:MAG: putative FAD-linked oxidoreductase [Alphaproteobacteria bacterium MarineAlpha11_Bin1]|tara:strand:- start:1049 stop:2437 length:1389 start_codon:yes stop_codon:yes gene_type:complete